MISLKLDTSSLEMIEFTNRMKEEIIKASRIPSQFFQCGKQGNVTSGDGVIHKFARG
jgi:hypothetical protein